VSRDARAGRSRQRGFADSLPPQLAALIFAVLAAMVVGFVLSFVLPARLLGGQTRRRALILVATVWLGLLGWYIVKPNIDGNWRLATFKECEAQAAAQPGLIDADGFADEAALLRNGMILQLFAERRVSFIEIKVNTLTRKGPVIAMADGTYEPDWTVPGFQAPWVRLELGKAGSPDCTVLPRELEGQLSRPPFLPDTCLALRYLNEPGARYALSLQPARDGLHVQGKWQVMDRSTGQAVMSLATVDPTGTHISAGRALSRAGQPALIEGTSPHTMLADRIRKSPPREPAPPDQVFMMEQVRADRDIAAIRADGLALPAVQAVSQSTHRTDQEQVTLMEPERDRDAWPRAVEAAKTEGLAAYGQNLVDWPHGALVTLVPSAAAYSYPLKVLAVGKGFLAVTTVRGASDPAQLMIARFRRDGTLAWARQVGTPDQPSAWCQGFRVEAAYATTLDLVLADRCVARPDAPPAPAGLKVNGQLWRIPLAALPPLD